MSTLNNQNISESGKKSLQDDINARQKIIDEMNANQALEGHFPDEADKKIQAEYIAGTVDLSALMKHALNFAIKSAKK